MTPGHLVYRVSYLDFICMSLEANQMPKKGIFGYDMKHTKMNEWSREDSSPHSDLMGHLNFSNLYWLKSLAKAILVVNMKVVESIWIDFENRHCTKFSIYSGYMMKGLNYTEILYTERLIKQLIFLIFRWSWWLARVRS